MRLTIKTGEVGWIIKKDVVITNEQKLKYIGNSLIVLLMSGMVAGLMALVMSTILAWVILEAGHV